MTCVALVLAGCVVVVDATHWVRVGVESLWVPIVCCGTWGSCRYGFAWFLSGRLMWGVYLACGWYDVCNDVDTTLGYARVFLLVVVLGAGCDDGEWYCFYYVMGLGLIA